MMSFRRSLTIVAILIWAAVAVTAAPQALSRHRAIVALAASTTIRSHVPTNSNSCSDLGIRFDDRETVYQSEDRTITKSEASPLNVQAEANGGVYVEGWDQDNYAVTLCKATEAGSNAESLLSEIHLTLNRGDLGVSGPVSTRRWAAFLYIRAPK